MKIEGDEAPALDLDLLEQHLTTDLVVRNPLTGAATPARITLAGPEHPDRKRLTHAALRRHRDEHERTGKIGLEPDEAEAQTLGIVVGSTLGWRGLRVDGKALEFSADACTRLYSDPRFAWLRDQVKAALDRRDLFIGASSGS